MKAIQHFHATKIAWFLVVAVCLTTLTVTYAYVFYWNLLKIDFIVIKASSATVSS